MKPTTKEEEYFARQEAERRRKIAEERQNESKHSQVWKQRREAMKLVSVLLCSVMMMMAPSAT